MILKTLKLEDFRNYKSLELNLSAKTTVLLGLNAQGKTNLLESIAFLALGKSFRAVKSLDTLKWDSPHGRIRGVVEKNGRETKLEVFLQRNPEMKKVKKGAKVEAPKSFLGNFRVVLFTPEHLGLIDGSPAERRKYMDRLLLQLNDGYVESFSTFQRLLDHRNALLKLVSLGRARPPELDVWDTRLAVEAEKIWHARRSFMDFLGQTLNDDYQFMATPAPKTASKSTPKTLTLEYQINSASYPERLAASRENDLRNGATSLGPHRDDFTLLLAGHDLSKTGSRGEKRSAVLALKIAERKFIEEKTGEKPVLLLDDVFSELDSSRQKRLAGLLTGYQSLIATTSREHIKVLTDPLVYEVKNGTLKEV
jgi:DNA replication and repair protein RecF